MYIYIISSIVFLLIILSYLCFKRKYSLLIRFENGKFNFVLNKKEYHKNNKIIIVKNGKQKRVKKIKGLEINFYGDNNTLICPKSCKFSDCVVHFSGSNINLKFGENCSIVQMKAILGGGPDGNEIYIGEGFVNSGIFLSSI